MLDELTAMRFDREMFSGRTGPLLLGAERADGAIFDVVAKFSEGAGIGAAGLTREALCAMLAADLGLPVPQPFLIRIEDAFIASLGSIAPDVARLLSTSESVGFGSCKLPPGYATWMPDRSIPKTMQQSAAEIFAFDLLIQNPDRRPENPNLHSHGESFAIFDHELALVTDGVLFWKPPWEQGALVGDPIARNHILRFGLQGVRPDYSRLIGAWEAISDARLDAYRAALPEEWRSAAAVADRAVAFLRELRDNVRRATQEVCGVL